jgi:hypothetical protein
MRRNYPNYSHYLNVGKIEIIEWFLGLSEVQTKGYRLAGRLKHYSKQGVLEDTGEHYELTSAWLGRYVFCNSMFAKVPATLKELGGRLDRPSRPAAGRGWVFPSHLSARMAVSYLGSYGIVAETCGTTISDVSYWAQP